LVHDGAAEIESGDAADLSRYGIAAGNEVAVASADGTQRGRLWRSLYK
jgi:hypothetical protein